MPRSVDLCSYGACQTVTGSRHLLRIDGRGLLLDCGLFQGRREEARRRNQELDIACDAVLLSHAHIDHSGALPYLVKKGFRGPIHSTPATADLCRAMLIDSARIARSNARDRRGGSDDDEEEPLYDEEDVEQTLRRFESHDYEEPFEVQPGVRASFLEAGHIIGSAGVLVEIDGSWRLFFTGDVGRRMYPILKDPIPAPESDVVISECTYGTREHEPSQVASGAFLKVIRRVIAEKGRLLIPAFSVGRAQNLVYAIAQAWHGERLERCPVFVDSPLAEKATDVFTDHPEAWDSEVEEFLAAGGRPFHPRGVHYLETSAQSKELNDRDGPFVVIAGSGMCEGGRIVHHLRHGLGDPKTTVLFVGWCAPHTLGRRLLDGDRSVRIFGRDVEVAARVERLAAYSAHAGRSELLQHLSAARKARVFLVHGEAEVCDAFAAELRRAGHGEVTVTEERREYPLSR